MFRYITDILLSVLVILLFAIGVIVVSPFVLVYYIRHKLKGGNRA